jgi:hypothetical protein
VYGCGGRGLEGEPFLQAGAAEGVKAVEEGERLVEEVGTDLNTAELAGASSSLSGPQEPWRDSEGATQSLISTCSRLAHSREAANPRPRTRQCDDTPLANTTNLNLDLPSTSVPSPDRPVLRQRARPQPWFVANCWSRAVVISCLAMRLPSS